MKNCSDTAWNCPKKQKKDIFNKISEAIACLCCQVLKVSQVYQEAPDVQGLQVPKEREETLVLEVSLVHKVNLHESVWTVS